MDAVDAFDLELVKQIEVASFESKDYHNNAYLKLVSVDNKKSPITAKIELDADKNGKITCARARELFADVGKALSFFKMLYENFVTPLNLPYIIEDELH